MVEITTRLMASEMGEKASHGENLMREMNSLLNSQDSPFKGRDLQDKVMADMLKLQNEGALPGLEFFDSSHKPVTDPKNAELVDEIKCKETAATVLSYSDSSLKLKDHTNVLESIDGFKQQFPDTHTKFVSAEEEKTQIKEANAQMNKEKASSQQAQLDAQNAEKAAEDVRFRDCMKDAPVDEIGLCKAMSKSSDGH